MCSRLSIVIFFGIVLSLLQLDVAGNYNLQNAKLFFKNVFHNTAKKLAFLNVYKLELTRHSISLEQFNLSSEVVNYAERIGRIIKAMENSLKALVSWTEEEVSKYSWNPKLKPDIIKYNDLRELKLGDKRLVDAPGYHFKIIPNKSGVHLPVEVYNGDSTVFHTLRWTDVLDSIFPTEPNLHFTYFASFTGILRVYPAFPWREQNVDMFDVRRRSWFIQGSSVPKDLFILLDTSGSMTGQSLKLANLSAQKLIEALDVDDYFTVAHFPGAKDHVAPMIVTANNESEPICFNSFVQATRRNKLRLFYDLSTLKARGYSDFPASLKFAYEMFRNLTGSARGDRGKELRNKILVLLTDNAFVFDESVLSQLKQQKSNITTFIYSLGEPVGAAYEHKMKACATNDYYQYLPTVGAVSNLMKDFHEKSTQIRFGPNASPLPTEVILHGASDVLHTNQYKGTGLMVSISIPVYNRTEKLQFLGLMGTELPIELMMNGLPQSKLYPTGYAFIVNTNGYLVFHPGLIPEYPWLDDSPYLDFLDVEFNVYGSKTLIRKKLIDNARGSEQIIDFIKVSDNVHTYVKPRLYSFTRLSNTDFGVAFVMPTDQQLFLSIPKSIKSKITTDGSGNYMIDDVLIKNLIKKAKIILPWKALDVYMKINDHVFNLETPNEHVVLHRDEDDQINVKATLMNEKEEEYEITNKKETVMEDKEERQQFTASTSLNDEFISMENELLSSHLNDTFCVNNTNCLIRESFLRKLIIRSTPSSSKVNDESENTPDIKNFNGYSSIILTDQIKETTRVLQSSESITPPSSPRSETSVGVSDILIDKNRSSIQTPVENTRPMDKKPITTEVNMSAGFESTTIATTATTSATSVLLTSPNDTTSQSTLDMTKNEVDVNNDGVGSDRLITEQNNEIRNFLEKIRNINSSQTELLSQILLEIMIAEKDVSESAESIKLNSPIISRTIALNTGLIWTIPINTNEQFYNELKHWPNSPIFQRVYDSFNLIFWVRLRMNEDSTKSIESPVVTEDNSNSLLQSNTKQIIDNDTINITAQTSENQLQITPTTTNSTINNTKEEQNLNQVDGNKNIRNKDEVIDDYKHSHIEIDEYFDESLLTLNDDETVENMESINETIMNSQDNTALPVTIFTSITITQGPNVYKAGVMGITLEPDYLSEQLNMIPECSVTQSNKLCYLLEDAANIIAVNNKLLYYQIGQFLGYIDPDLMNSLVQNHVYGVLKDYDFEGTCFPREDMLETTSPGIHPIPSILMYTQSLFKVRVWLDRLLTVGSVSAFITRAFIMGMIRIIVSGDLNDDVDPQNKPYQCIKLIHRYYSLNGELYGTRNPSINVGFNHGIQGFISCPQQRNRDWSVQWIIGTNLLLLITDPIFAECENKTHNNRLRRDPVKGWPADDGDQGGKYHNG
ncbi:unnamed protein product [Schistosoma rodhaini]|uniref:VWFA domain-containing protein n=2 Tax=Schistosoma rodhaini TaxID=6188 RepID=A0AA85FX41_9TREM|nr:unnamed protein product [Schistosoma rodhaini]CAH8574169.1 unnamed protein product [Schistosoma rodhaini]